MDNYLIEKKPMRALLLFALPIIIGLVAGNFTSIFVAPSLWGRWQDRVDAKRAAGRRAGKVKPKKA